MIRQIVVSAAAVVALGVGFFTLFPPPCVWAASEDNFVECVRLDTSQVEAG